MLPFFSSMLCMGTVSAQSIELKKGNIVDMLTADKLAYGPEDEVLLTFIISNTGKEDVTFEYSNSQFHDFIIKAADGTEVARWSLGRAFLPVEKPVPLGAGKTLNFNKRRRRVGQNDRPARPGRHE